jgi:hypothetical protein
MARPVGVEVSMLPEVVEHRYQIAETAAQPVELQHNERVAVFQLLEAAQKGRALGGGSRYSLILEHGLASGLLQRRELQCGVLVAGRDAGVAYFHCPHFDPDI